MRWLPVALGALTVLLSFWLAVVSRYNHFYEITLLGLLLILLPFVYPKLLNLQILIKLYLISIAAALFFDWLIVLHWTHLWHYDYATALGYMPLYLFVYPAGTIVMLSAYLLVRNRFDTHLSGFVFNKSVYIALATLTIVLLVVGILPVTPKGFGAIGITGSAALLLVVLSMILSEQRHKNSYLRDLLSNPIPCIKATLCATYANLLIHEYPNIYVHEWTYTVQTGTVLDAMFLGIPVLVWLGWPVLTVVPVSFYYLFKKDEVGRVL